jgi:COMPASS component BRE2
MYSEAPEIPPAGGINAAQVPATPVPAPGPASLPQKRTLDDDHVPAVSSPLNPDFTSRKPQVPEESSIVPREKRTKKESLKKRESKAASTPGGPDSSRATPDPRQIKKSRPNLPAAEVSPARYILPLPKATDFEPARGPQLVPHHEVAGPDGESIEFFETQEQ